MRQAVSHLVHTSVDDLRSSLRCARDNGRQYSRETLTMARDLAESMGMRSKVRALEAELRWLDRGTK